ncbi:MAG TPA: hypothetical protein VHO69_15870 [Phototrophicaceae bacterium]|nr:hypothetical protein [Phototrophicaceae bacterium]
MEKEKPKHKAKGFALETDLMAALNFTDEDLEANRDGRLSQRQRQRFAKMQANITTEIYLAGFVGLIGIPILVYWYHLHSVSWLEAVPPALISSFVCLMLVLSWWERRIMLAADLREESVETLQGLVKLEHLGKSGGHFNLQNQNFPLSSKALLAFKNGDPYCIYYAPNTRTLLSAEWLRED